MATNADCVRTVCKSDTYAKFALKYVKDHEKIQRRLAGYTTTEPSSLFGQGLARSIIAPTFMPGLAEHVKTVMRSQPYTEWLTYRTASGTYPHKTDHNKLLKTLAGGTTTSPAGNLPKGLWQLLKQPTKPPDPDQPPPPGSPVWPPDVGFMHDIFKKQVVFVRELSNFAGDVRAEAFAHDWKVIAIQLDNVPYADSNVAELKLIRGQLEAAGAIIGGWGTSGQGTENPFDEGRRQAGIVKALNLKFWIPNMEWWAEADNYWKCAAWIDGWLDAGGAVPVAVSMLSSNTPDWARAFDYQSWITRLPGSAIMPQTYGSTIPSYTVYNAVETLKRGHVPKNRVSLTFDVTNGNGPFTDYNTWLGARGMYTGDDARVGTFAAFDR